jgi:asparagine N-glycosylation enzyme membrane subunit Stt3
MPTASAVLGTLALLAVVLSFGLLFFVALPVGLLAIFLAVAARRRGAAATIGLVTGVLSTILSLLVVGLIVAVVVFLDGLDVGGLPDAVREGIPDDVLRELEEQLPEGIEGIQGRV